MKAQFQMTIIRHESFNSSLFNTPLIDSTVDENDSEWIRDRFERTVTMSTYLIAFVVSNFKGIHTHSPKYNIQIDIYARPDAIDNGEGQYALGVASLIIDFFTDYFNVSYPLKKLSISFLKIKYLTFFKILFCDSSHSGA